MVNNSTTEQALRNLIAATEEMSESFGVDVKPFKTEHQLIENNVICALTMARSALQSNKHSGHGPAYGLPPLSGSGLPALDDLPSKNSELGGPIPDPRMNLITGIPAKTSEKS